MDAFSLRLFKAVGSSAVDSNFVFSPLSIHAVLSLVAAGSKGQTLHQLLSVLHSMAGASADELHALASQVVQLVLADASNVGGPRLSFASGVFVDASMELKDSFKEIVGGTYRAEVKAVDFRTKAIQVTKEINSWIENATTGLIKDLLPHGSIDAATRLVLSNALYFKGAWTEKFDASATKDYEFHLLNNTSIQAPFMMTSYKNQYLSAYDGFKVLGLRYKQGEDKRQFSMYIFLPDTKDGIWNLLEKLSSESEFFNHHLPRQKVAARIVRLPKFKISFGFEASEVLKGLGLTLPFRNVGELTEMVDSPFASQLSVSSIFHKSFIEVNEEGTEAVAASAVVTTLTSASMSLGFIADHPFIFVIREDTAGVVLFIGHVLNPLLDA